MFHFFSFDSFSSILSHPTFNSTLMDLTFLAQVTSITEKKKALDWIDVISVLVFTGLVLFAVCKSSWRR